MEKVIFDTNAYRYLAADKTNAQIDKAVKKLKASEKRNKIESLISPIVVKELLAHLADKNDPAFDKCLKANRALYQHNSDKDGNYRMLASPELLMSQVFYQKTIPAKVHTNQALGQISYHLATNPTAYVFKKFQNSLNLNRDHVLETENEFALAMRQFIQAADPSATGWRILENDEAKRTEVLKGIRSERASVEIAVGYLFTVYMFLVSSGQIVQMTPEDMFKDLFEKAKLFITVYPEPIALYKLVMENMVNSEFNLMENSRGNFVWDIHLMFNVGSHSIGGEKVHFVTSDKAIIKTAIKENAKYSIHTFDEYMEYLK
jgi:hypothetical protein